VICAVSPRFIASVQMLTSDFTCVCCISSSVLPCTYLDYSKSTLPTDLRDCIAMPLPRYTSSVWISTAAVEVILFGLAFPVCLQHFRELRAVGQWNPRSLLGILFHDSIFYILIALTAHVSAAILWYLAPVSRAIAIIANRNLTSSAGLHRVNIKFHRA
jgi:hypothetical protein